MANYTFNNITICGIATAIPKNRTEREELETRFGLEQVSQYLTETAVQSFPKSIEPQTTSDLGFEAAKQIISAKQIDVEQIGLIVFISKTPDYRSPVTAAVLHQRLQLSVDCIAYDINIGSSGFIYGLQIGCSVLSNINKLYALLVIGDTTSKQIDSSNPKSMLYGDGASAILLKNAAGSEPIQITSAANGEGYKSVIFPGGGFRMEQFRPENMEYENEPGRLYNQLHINEQEMNEFAVSEIPLAIKEYLKRINTNIENYDFLAFHHDNKMVRERLAEVLHISPDLLPSNINKYGNTMGNSIPLLLTDSFGTANKTIRVLACAYGEGFSWGIADFIINTKNIFPVTETDEYFQEANVSHEF